MATVPKNRGLTSQQRHHSLAHILDSETVFAHHNVAWSRRTISVDTQHVTMIADIAMPALRRARLDCEPPLCANDLETTRGR